ncbi:spore germination protein GerPB [Fredinandcohnia quinoae]|uniref:Spore germination protein GerPB n=1 Tax=Fredinandcohnia quinoae TaxID=2918902 RepID=A0AAW5E0I4_9BACI|nr:spore germination protein GerPB [Fredinandcohnia sp. SECRCQ15]MCH1625828.1 spore germination protein GerPB [Fredinandcohnia sp. SECRCQ15]
MNYYINQTICIQSLKIGSINNSSVLQIGSAGIIKPVSHLHNTGGFTEPAPEAVSSTLEGPAVPLTSPTSA